MQKRVSKLKTHAGDSPLQTMFTIKAQASVEDNLMLAATEK